MATKVSQKYGKNGVATSITKKNGRISKFTLWYPGVVGSTQRVVVPSK